MGFLFLIILIFLTFFIIKAIKSSKDKEFHNHTYDDNFHNYYNDFDHGLDEDFEEEFSNDTEKSSFFPYPDPYEIPPSSSMYLDEDGELLDDL